MSVRVINIDKENEPILGFLFPSYCITESSAVTSKFITHRLIKSKMEREVLDLQYEDAVFISSQIFDEFWDEDKIKQECIEFARVYFKSRKKSFNTSRETFVQDCLNFMFGIPSIEEDSDIMDLFESVGSNMFPVKFIKCTQVLAPQQVYAALTTFFCKLTKDSSSVYYRKKALFLEDKIQLNLVNALEKYTQTAKDSYGLAECRLFMDIVK